MARHLHLSAIKGCSGHNYIRAASLLQLHDSYEIFYNSIFDSRNAPIPKSITFDAYPKIIKEQLDIELRELGGASKLNKSRVSLKHHGILPSRDDLVYFIETSRVFFSSNCRAVFAVDWESVGIESLVDNSEAKKHIAEAAQRAENGEYKRAAIHVAAAFEKVRMDATWGQFSPMRRALSDSFENFSLSEFRLGENQSLAKAFDAVQERFFESAIGLEPFKWRKFRALTPKVLVNPHMDGQRFITPRGYEHVHVGPEEYAFCLDFLIDFCINLKTIDLDVVYKDDPDDMDALFDGQPKETTKMQPNKSFEEKRST